MLRPATPLAFLLAGAFGLLLISILSVPIIKAIPLGEYDSVRFGVFGYCKNNDCSPIEIGYDDRLSTLIQQESANFDLPSSARRTLSTILIIHPVAALMTLIMFAMAVAAHFHSASHSARYLLIVFIMGILDTIVCLLAFLIDVLLFVPHMAWGSYLVLAATIMVALSGLVSCAMRRTLVSRKARKKRIEENAEMSGENFYNRQGPAVVVPTSSMNASQPTVPAISGANGSGPVDKLPEFATFEKKDDHSSDERFPLTSRSPDNRSPNPQYNAQYPNMNASDGQSFNSGPGPNRAPSARDQYGNPIDPSAAYGVRRGPSQESMRGRGGPPGYRGRGGYGPPGRGGPGGPYGGYGPPPNGRGGYGPPGRGGYHPPNGRGGGYGPPQRGGYGAPMRGRPPPPGYQYETRGPPSDGYGAPGPYEQQQRGSPGPYGQQQRLSPGPPGYGMNGSTATVSSGSYHNHTMSEDLPRAESPPPLPGQAIEMDATTTGSPTVPQNGFQGRPNQQFRDSDADIAGMVGLQQGITPIGQRHDTYISEVSKYSQDDSQYVPTRANWNSNDQGRQSPAHASSVVHPSMMPQPLGSRSDLSTRTRSPLSEEPKVHPKQDYWEDVDPKFLPESQRGTKTPPAPIQINNANTPDYDELPAGARSPAESERSTFTSISQRGINPRWVPPPPTLMPGYGASQYGPSQRGQPNSSEVLLNNNPDFELPTVANRGSPSRRGRMIPGSAYSASRF